MLGSGIRASHLFALARVRTWPVADLRNERADVPFVGWSGLAPDGLTRSPVDPKQTFLRLHGSLSRPRRPALMASVFPHTGAFLLNEFSIVVNIDQRGIGAWGKTGSIAVPNRQLSATERSVMLPPNTREA